MTTKKLSKKSRKVRIRARSIFNWPTIVTSKFIHAIELTHQADESIPVIQGTL